MTKRNYLLLSVITIFLVLLIDQWTKIWVKANIPLYEIFGELGIIKFQFIENKGMAFGLELGDRWGKILLSLFRVVAIIAIGFGIRNLIKNKVNWGLILCTSLIFAGALGNLLDSMFYGWMFSDSLHGAAEFMPENGGYAPFLMGSVVDMIHVEFYYPSWMPFGLAEGEVFPPIFNVADMAVSGGVIAMIVFNKKIFGEHDFNVFLKKSDKKEEESNTESGRN